MSDLYNDSEYLARKKELDEKRRKRKEKFAINYKPKTDNKTVEKKDDENISVIKENVKKETPRTETFQTKIEKNEVRKTYDNNKENISIKDRLKKKKIVYNYKPSVPSSSYESYKARSKELDARREERKKKFKNNNDILEKSNNNSDYYIPKESKTEKKQEYVKKPKVEEVKTSKTEKKEEPKWKNVQTISKEKPTKKEEVKVKQYANDRLKYFAKAAAAAGLAGLVSFGIAKKAAEYYIEHDQQMIEQQQRTQNNIEESKYIHENVLNLGLKNPDYYDEYDNNIDNSNEKPKCNEYSNKENTNEEQKYDGYGNKIDNTYDEQKYYDYDERE